MKKLPNILTAVAFGAITALSFTNMTRAADLDVSVPEPDSAVLPAKKSLLDGFYVKAYGGAAFVQDEGFNGTANATGADFQVNLDFNTGFHVGGAIGRRFDDLAFGLSPRIELDVNFVRAGVQNEEGAGNGSNFNGGDQVFGGSQSVVFVGTNALVDFDFLGNKRVLPYLGGGVGAAFFNSRVNYFPVAAPGTNIAFNDANLAFAAQAIGGVEYAVTDKISFNIEGRYLRAFDLNVDRVISTAGPSGTLFGDANGRFSAVTVGAGISYKF